MSESEMSAVMEKIGELNGDVRGLRENFDRLIDTINARFKEQGERMGQHEKDNAASIERFNERLDSHIEICHRPGNGWRSKATYAGGGGALIALVEAVRHLLEH